MSWTSSARMKSRMKKVAIELTESWNETEFDNIKNTITSLQKLGIKFSG